MKIHAAIPLITLGVLAIDHGPLEAQGPGGETRPRPFDSSLGSIEVGRCRGPSVHA